MGKIALNKVLGKIYYLPEEMQAFPESAIACYKIKDKNGNIGYCCVVENEIDECIQNGVYYKCRDFAALVKIHYNGGNGFAYKHQMLYVCDRIDPRKIKIVDYLKNERKVEYLYHFTPCANLPGIVKYGIVPKECLEDDANAICLDDVRADGREDCSSFSISFPNYQMLYSRYNKSHIKHVIIEIDIDCLKSIDYDNMLFFPSNAAKKEYRNLESDSFQGLEAVKRMFDNNRQGGIPDSYTTDPQAELLIRGKIPPEKIHAIYLNRKFMGEDYCSSSIPSEFRKKALWDENGVWFSPRCDYEKWKKESVNG